MRVLIRLIPSRFNIAIVNIGELEHIQGEIGYSEGWYADQVPYLHTTPQMEPIQASSRVASRIVL